MKTNTVIIAAVALVFLLVEGGLSEVKKPGPGGVNRSFGPGMRTTEAINQPKVLTKEQTESIQQENTVYLNERLAGAKNLTNAEKDELIKIFIAKWPSGVNLKDKPNTGTVMFFQRLADHPKFKMEQKVKILNDYLDRIKKIKERSPLRPQPKAKK